MPSSRPRIRSASGRVTTGSWPASRSSAGVGGHGHEPALEPALRAPPEPPRQPARGRRHEPPPRPRRRRRVRGREGLRQGRWRRDARVVAARNRPRRLGGDPVVEPAVAAIRPRRRQGPGRADLPAPRFDAPSYEPLSDDPNLHPGRTARGRVVAEGNLVAGRAGALHPALAADLDLDGPVVVAELAIVGLAGGLIAPARGATPAAPPGRRARPRGRRRRGPACGRVAASLRRMAASCSRRWSCSTCTAADRSRRPRRALPGGSASGSGSHAHRGRDRRRDRGHPRRPGRRCRRPYSRLSGTFGPVAAPIGRCYPCAASAPVTAGLL